MAKGQVRSNKEVRKPKKDKKAAGASASAAPAAPAGSKFATAQPELVRKKKERPA
ncbi:hypothetical protein [Aureimonas psammosilenae]|uniref:hypothetical protein n=1 Tax=Aureimonas psammosilenae TaxID=2495496 RepID=UPI00186AB690|nr:hypothetical protein [Aureimonas psammosilenae]